MYKIFNYRVVFSLLLVMCRIKNPAQRKKVNFELKISSKEEKNSNFFRE